MKKPVPPSKLVIPVTKKKLSKGKKKPKRLPSVPQSLVAGMVGTLVTDDKRPGNSGYALVVEVSEAQACFLVPVDPKSSDSHLFTRLYLPWKKFSFQARRRPKFPALSNKEHFILSVLTDQVDLEKLDNAQATPYVRGLLSRISRKGSPQLIAHVARLGIYTAENTHGLEMAGRDERRDALGREFSSFLLFRGATRPKRLAQIVAALGAIRQAVFDVWTLNGERFDYRTACLAMNALCPAGEEARIALDWIGESGTRRHWFSAIVSTLARNYPHLTDTDRVRILDMLASELSEGLWSTLPAAKEISKAFGARSPADFWKSGIAPRKAK